MQNNHINPYLLNIHHQAGETLRLSLISVRLLIGLAQGLTARETSRPGTWYRDEALTYCYSVRQREQSYLRHLKFATQFVELRYHTLHAYIPPHPAVETMSAPNERQKTKDERQKTKDKR